MSDEEELLLRVTLGAALRADPVANGPELEEALHLAWRKRYRESLAIPTYEDGFRDGARWARGEKQ